MKLLRIAALLLLVTAALIGSIATPVSAAESTLGFRVAPAAGSSVSEGADYFVLEMAAGDSQTQAIEVSNDSERPLRVQVAAVDAATAQMGGVDYASEELASEATGQWITLNDRTIPLAPGGSTQVPFDVEVPADAVTGVHLAGLAIWVEGDEQKADSGAQASISVQSRRVIAVQVEVPGPASPMLEIRGAQAEARPDGLYLGIDLFNSGTGFAAGTGTVSIEGRDQVATFVLDTVVPRTGTNFPFRWSGSSVPNGSYEVSIEVDYGTAIATWQGEVTVGPAVQSDLSGRGIDGDGSPWLRTALVIAAVLLSIVGLFFLLRRRSLFSRAGSKPPRPAVIRPPLQPARSETFSRPQPPRAPAPPAVFVPRSEEEQRCVPPPPPPPPPARPVPPRPSYAGVAGGSNFDY